MNSTNIKVVLDNLSSLIMTELKACGDEQKYHQPQAQMDDIINDSKENAEKLRKIREDFENVASGIV